jgi:hypothetical protein
VSKGAARLGQQAEGGPFIDHFDDELSPLVAAGRRSDDRWDAGARPLHEGIGSPEGDSACQGPRTGSHGMTIVAAPHDPLPVLLSDNLADVVRHTTIAPTEGPPAFTP